MSNFMFATNNNMGTNMFDTNNNKGNISFQIEMANVNNDEIIKKKGSNQLDELFECLITIQQTLYTTDVVNKSVGVKKCRKRCNSAED